MRPGPARWEFAASVACSGLLFVPVIRIPASFVLLCLLPGIAICRHRLGETSPLRAIVLGSLISLCVMPAVGIPAALVAGRPSAALAAVLACLVTLLASVRPVAARPSVPLTRPARLHVAALAALALAMQIAATVVKHPAPDTIRWRGLPDLMFFDGIYTQLAHSTPPLDPENGAALLVHNWIYHFHFVLVQIAGGLTVPQMQRLVSAWLALVLLGLVYLLCHDRLGSPRAGLLACLFLMASGEVAWVLRSLASLSLQLRPMPWEHSPFGVTLLFGWYNLPPLAAGLGAWYWMERYRDAGRRADLVVSASMCVAMAFFHPVFFGVFMIGFCLWLAFVSARDGLRPAWLAFLATPIPFFLLYKLPYYGLAMPPRVVHVATADQILSQARELMMSAGIYLIAGLIGLVLSGARLGPSPYIAASSIALDVLVRAPNPHWFNDLAAIALCIATGLALARLIGWSARAGVAVSSACLLVGATALWLHLSTAFATGYTFSGAEMAAGEWLDSNAGQDDLVAILPNSPSSYTVLGIGHRRLVHGWTGHLLDFHDYAKRQEADVREIFTTRDPARAVELARRYRVDWVYLGAPEQAVAAGAGPIGDCFPMVFSRDGVEVRAFTCGEGGPEPSRAANP